MDFLIITDINNGFELTDALNSLKQIYNEDKEMIDEFLYCFLHDNNFKKIIFSKNKNIFNLNENRDKLSEILENMNEFLFFYFSGHIVDNNIVLPDDSFYKIEDIKKHIIGKIKEYYSVIDSCYAKKMFIENDKFKKSEQFFSSDEFSVTKNNKYEGLFTKKILKKLFIKNEQPC